MIYPDWLGSGVVSEGGGAPVVAVMAVVVKQPVVLWAYYKLVKVVNNINQLKLKSPKAVSPLLVCNFKISKFPPSILNIKYSN